MEKGAAIQKNRQWTGIDFQICSASSAIMQGVIGSYLHEMTTHRNIKSLLSRKNYVKGMFLDHISLSGTAGGAKYVIGVSNPLKRTRHVHLGRDHLMALDVLLSFASRDNLEEAFTVSKAAFVKRFGSESGWKALLELLGSWLTIQTTGYPVYATAAEVLVVTMGRQVDLSVRFGSSLALILKVLLSRSQVSPHPATTNWN